MKSTLVSFIFLFNVMVNAQVLECSLENHDGSQSTTALLPIAVGEVQFSDKGIDVGENNYSFVAEYNGDAENNHQLTVVIDENNNVQDEVAFHECAFSSDDLLAGDVCKQTFTNIDGVDLKFLCHLAE